VRLKRSNQAGSLENLGKVAFETVTRPSEMKLGRLELIAAQPDVRVKQ